MVALALNIPDQPTGNIDVISAIDSIFSYVWPVFIAFSVIVFIWAGFLFLTAHGDPNKLTSARHAVIWGAIGVAIALLASSIPFLIDNILSGF